MTKFKRVLVGAALGVACGAVLGPGMAMAETKVSVSGTSVTVTTGCPGPTSFAITGMGKSYNVISGATPGGASASFTEATAGTYKVTAECDGSSASFTIAPRGGPASGDGGRADNTLTLLGGTALIGAAAGGFVLMRRRANR